VRDVRTDLRSLSLTRETAGRGLVVLLSAALFAMLTLVAVSPAVAGPLLVSAGVEDRTAPAIPTDTWLNGTLTLYPDHVEGTFNGHTLTLQAPVQRVLDYTGGLVMDFNENDDYSRGGYDFDFVKVEQGPGMPTTLFSDFVSPDLTPWKMTFFDAFVSGQRFNPTWGTVSVANGALSLKPGKSRGACELYTHEAVVTALPARVSFRVRFPVTAFRSADLFLFSSDRFDANGQELPGFNEPGVRFGLGTTNHLFWPVPEQMAVTWPDLPPVAAAGPDKQTTLGLPTGFDGSASHDDGTIVSYAWDFGDRTTGSGATATHKYAAVGTYTATLTVTDDAGQRGTDSLTVKVRPVPATVRFSPNPLNLKSAGNDVTCFISLPTGYSPTDIRVSTVRITSIGGTVVSIPAVPPASVNDNRLMVKFNRAQVIRSATYGGITFTVGGTLTGGAIFSGSDLVKVIH
jgi:hypothetical protein